MNEYAPALMALAVALVLFAMLGYQVWTEKKTQKQS